MGAYTLHDFVENPYGDISVSVHGRLDEQSYLCHYVGDVRGERYAKICPIGFVETCEA